MPHRGRFREPGLALPPGIGSPVAQPVQSSIPGSATNPAIIPVGPGVTQAPVTGPQQSFGLTGTAATPAFPGPPAGQTLAQGSSTVPIDTRTGQPFIPEAQPRNEAFNTRLGELIQTQDFITNQFQQSLGRAPTREDIEFYAGELARGKSPELISQQIAGSQEGQGIVTPPTGLIGSEQALQGGLESSIDVLGQSIGQERADISGGGAQAIDFLRAQAAQGQGLIERGAAGFDPFIDPGQNAAQLRGDLSGANGPEAQARAIANFQSSPGQEFLRSRQEQAILRNAAATGGIGGGNVLKALQDRAFQLAQTDFGNQFQRLGDVSGEGLQATAGAGGLLGQGAALAGQTGQTGAGIFRDIGAQLGTTAGTGGRNIASLLTGAATNVAAGRLGTGQNIEAAIAGTTTALSDLQERGGAGAADIVGGGAAQISDVIRTAGQGLADDQLQQLQLLVNAGLVTSEQMVNALLARGGTSTGGTAGLISDIGGGKGIAATAALLSDQRLKENIFKIGESPAGTNLYTWDWTDEALIIVGDQPAIGVIADEIQLTQPHVVSRGTDGFLRVDYARAV